MSVSVGKDGRNKTQTRYGRWAALVLSVAAGDEPLGYDQAKHYLVMFLRFTKSGDVVDNGCGLVPKSALRSFDAPPASTP